MKVEQQGPEEREHISKLWGFEEILYNGPEYCAKLLWLLPGFQCSLHYHKVKHESFIALDGLIRVEYYEGNTHYETILSGHRRDRLTLPPGTPHRFWSMGSTGGLILEVSTTHSDEDVVRIEPSKEQSNHVPLLGTQTPNA